MVVIFFLKAIENCEQVNLNKQGQYQSKNFLTLTVFGLETGSFFNLIRILPEINWSQTKENKLTSEINKASITVNKPYRWQH